MKYRIKEYNGLFIIQVRGYEEKGMLWWKKKEYNWYRANIWGGVTQFYPIAEPVCDFFKTLEAAREQIKRWKKGVTYHDA